MNKPSVTCSIDFLHICYDTEEFNRTASCAFIIAFLVGSLFNFISEEFQFTVSDIIVVEQDGENAYRMVTMKYLYSHALVIFEFFFWNTFNSPPPISYQLPLKSMQLRSTSSASTELKPREFRYL